MHKKLLWIALLATVMSEAIMAATITVNLAMVITTAIVLYYNWVWSLADGYHWTVSKSKYNARALKIDIFMMFLYAALIVAWSKAYQLHPNGITNLIWIAVSVGVVVIQISRG